MQIVTRAWTQILLIGAQADVEKELGIRIDSWRENAAERAGFRQLRQEASEADASWHVDIFEPLCRGKWE